MTRSRAGHRPRGRHANGIAPAGGVPVPGAARRIPLQMAVNLSG